MPYSSELRITDVIFRIHFIFFCGEKKFSTFGGDSITQKGNKLWMEGLEIYLKNLGTHKGVKSFGSEAPYIRKGCLSVSVSVSVSVCKLRISREDALHLVIIPLFVLRT